MDAPVPSELAGAIAALAAAITFAVQTWQNVRNRKVVKVVVKEASKEMRSRIENLERKVGLHSRKWSDERTGEHRIPRRGGDE